MMRPAIFIILFMTTAHVAFAQDSTYKAIIQQLHTIDELDQRYRVRLADVEKRFGRDSKEIQQLYRDMDLADSVNLSKVVLILDQYGWLGPAEIGDQANTTLFLVIQHAGQATQEKYLPMMRDAVKSGKAKASGLALLEDRVALKQGRVQYYGSQVLWSNTENKYFVLPLDDPDNVDKRRAAAGLNSLSEYLRRWNITWDVEQYKQELPAILAETKKYFPGCCSKF